MAALTTSLYVITLAAALFAARDSIPPGGLLRLRATWEAVVVVAVPTLLQLTIAPGLLTALRRDWTLIDAGQWWRIVTTLVVQDGGVAGAVFNVASLVVVGAVAEQLFGRRAWLVIFLVAGIGSQFWGALVQPVGAGNSVAVFGLAAATDVFVLSRGKRPARVVAGAGLAAGMVLLGLGDLHGAAVVLGAAVALVWLRLRRGERRLADRREQA